MEILVCVKGILDTEENVIEPNADGSDIKRDDLVYYINEWDNYAVEEALTIRENVGGTVTLVSIGDEEADDVLRRGLAMGADKAVHITDEAFEDSDGRGIAEILKAEAGNGQFDLILTGAQADDGAGQVGGMLAEMLGWPYASLVKQIQVLDEKAIRAGREIAGGNIEVSDIRLPCVLSIQTGINQPRYVSSRGWDQAYDIEIPMHDAETLEMTGETVGPTGARVQRLNYFSPDTGGGAKMLEGNSEQVLTKLAQLLVAGGRTNQ
ncbi:MAG: electron transfer flavoprotein subunit beta/FixA family protein [Deltaproteobacteria bacterium]|nr:electron transfer flavoprotein subunit beta/FixA family protein [Deltaproteobacteria bacterium]